MNIKHYCLGLTLVSVMSVAMDSGPSYLYKIVSPEEWEKSQRSGYVIPGSNDTSFIHLSKEDQVAGVVSKFYKSVPHFILKVQPSKFSGELKYETNPGGSTKYYHLYAGRIPLDAIVEAKKVSNQ